jgi:hypothetical protein
VEESMRNILLAGGAILLASCATPTMTAMNTGNLQQAAGANRDEQPPVPTQLRRPLRTLDGWATTGSGGMY